MALFINTNVWSLNAQRALALSQAELTRSLERLSTGLRINRASDDPVGNAVTERYTAQINGIDQARRNVSHGTVFAQHADSNLESVNDQLQAIRANIVKSNVLALDPSKRQALQDEIGVALAEVERLVQSTEFDGRKILSGTPSSSVFQVGPNATDTVGITLGDFRTNRFGLYRLKGNPTGTNAGGLRGRTGENLILEGSLGSRTVVIPAAGAPASAYETAAAVNAVRQSTGIHASARTDIEITRWLEGGYNFTIESKNITAPVTVTATVDVLPGETAPKGAAAFAALIKAINDKENDTGVKASLNGGEDGIILTNEAGHNIILEFSLKPVVPVPDPKGLLLREPTLSSETSTTNHGRLLGSTGTVSFTGQIIFDSESNFNVISEDASKTATSYPGEGLSLLADKPIKARRFSQSATLVPIADIDVTGTDAVRAVLQNQIDGIGVPPSAKDATPAVSENWILQGAIRDAFAVIDYAMARVTTQQAALGSAQNRFDAIIENLDSDYVNLNTARSYIRDTDFGLELAVRTRANLQRQINLEILGQTDALHQAVLALLK